MGYSEIAPKPFTWFDRNQSLSPWDSAAVNRFKAIPKATFITFSFFFLHIFIIFVYFYFLLGIHCIVWIGFAEEKFLEVAQEPNNVRLDGYKFFTESVKQSVERKICRKYDMPSGYCRTMGGWTGRKRILWRVCEACEKIKLGGWWRSETEDPINASMEWIWTEVAGRGSK